MIKLFPCNFVFWAKVNNHDEIKENYFSKILDDYNLNKEAYDQKNNWRCNSTSSFFNDSLETKINFFDRSFYDQVIWENFNLFFSEIKNTYPEYQCPIKSYVQNIWYNYYKKGQYQEIHNHITTLTEVVQFSGIYLFDIKESNKTVFKEYGNLSWNPVLNYEFSTASLEEGTVIIFPSSLLHFVEPCETDRITISFNIKCQYNF